MQFENSLLGSEPCQPVEDESRRIAGRVMNIRRFGKAAFLVLRDRSGDLQVMIRKNVVTGDGWDDFLLVDRGDHVGAAGNMFVTKTGELSVMVSEFRLLTKSLRPLPEKWKGLTDVEQRYRRRYVDLIVNPEARDTFRASEHSTQSSSTTLPILSRWKRPVVGSLVAA